MAYLYFSKVNLNEGIYEAYQNEKILINKLNYLYHNLSSLKEIFLDEEVYITNDLGKKEKKEIKRKYSFGTIYLKENKKILGTVIKHSKIIQNEKQKDGQVKEHVLNNDIPVTFIFDIDLEIITFIRRKGFGYAQFNEAFEKIINTTLDQDNFKIILLKNKSLAKEKIKTFIKINEIKSTFIPHNRNRDSFKALYGRKSDKLQSANAIKIIEIIEGGENGLNPESELIDDAITISAIGYGNVEVTGEDENGNKKVFSDNEKTPYIQFIPESIKKNLENFWNYITKNKFINIAYDEKEKIRDEFIEKNSQEE